MYGIGAEFTKYAYRSDRHAQKWENCASRSLTYLLYNDTECNVKMTRLSDSSITKSNNHKKTSANQYLHFSFFVPLLYKRGFVRPLYDGTGRILSEDTCRWHRQTWTAVWQQCLSQRTSSDTIAGHNKRKMNQRPLRNARFESIYPIEAMM